MTERIYLMLIDKCRNLLSTPKHLRPVLDIVKKTDFMSVKLVLNELNNDYLACMKLLMTFKKSDAGNANNAKTPKEALRCNGF